MKTLTALVIALTLSAGTAPAQTLPQPKAGSPGGSCPFGYTSSGAFCIPSQGGQQAVPLPLTELARLVGRAAAASASLGIVMAQQRHPPGPPMTLGC
jgi:hypothetical protein